MSVAAEPEKSRKGGRGVIALLSLLALGGGGYAGWTLSPFHEKLEGEATEAAPAEAAAEMSAGNFLINFGDGSEPVPVSVLVTPKPGEAPDPITVRDTVGRIILGMAEMPVIAGGGFSEENFRKGALVIAAQEAPWIEDLRMAPPGNTRVITDTREGASEEDAPAH